MKKFFYGLLLLVWAFVLSPVQAEDVDSGAFEIRVLTFNIRTSRGEVGKPEEWKNRRRGVVELIRRGDYDFVGVQEAIFSPQRARLNQVDYLKAALPDYGMIYRPRGESADRGEGTPLLYNRSRWVLDESEHGIFWLSPTPDVPGSRCDGSRLPRTVCWGRFIRLENGKPTDRAVYVFNTHFDLAFQAKVEGAIILAEFIAKRKHDDPVFIQDGVVHYCVGNMPGAVPRTSTIALTNATLKYGLQIAKDGLEEACKKSDVIVSGVNCYLGRLTNRNVAAAHGYDYTELSELI